MTAILLLNADASPLRVIPLKRAISLLSKSAVDILECVPNRLLRSAHTSQPFPSVIRLRYYVRVPRRKAIWSRRAVFARDNYTCVYCGSKLSREDATLDHLIPREQCAKLGIRASTWGNSVCSCAKCNRRKSNRTMRDAGMRFWNPDYEPRIPRTNYLIFSGEVPVEWKAYIEA